MERVTCEIRDADGDVVRIDVPPLPGTQRPPVPPLLAALAESQLRIALDPAAGVTSVSGIDRAIERASAAGVRDFEPAMLWSDARWARDLANAGMSAPPESLRAGAPVARQARVWVEGRGETTIRLAGEAGRDDRGSPAVRVAARLPEDAEFAFDAEPSSDAGAARVADVTCEATTSYAGDPARPIKGEWTVTTPFDFGPTRRRTTSFALVLR